MKKTVLPRSVPHAVSIPSSKSVVHRLLICAALGRRPVKLLLNGLSKDILATAACLEGFGTELTVSEREIIVKPGPASEKDVVLPCGESGSTLRFLLPVCGALGLHGHFRMEGRLPERPMQPLEAMLEEKGMLLKHEGALLSFSGTLTPGMYHLPGNISSQYFSGLLFALPLLGEESTLCAEGRMESLGYIALTEDALSAAQVSYQKTGDYIWHLPGGQHPQLPEEVSAEGDWSNAAFFLCMGALSPKGITLHGLNLHSRQGDKAILDLLRRFGADVKEDAAAGSVTVRRNQCCPFEVDASAIPDLVPVLSILACGAVGDTKIYNAARLRLKESDRLQTTARLISDLGGNAEEFADALLIHGTGTLKGGTADSTNDHRIAMSAATAAVLCGREVVILGAECVEKSYPGFWDDLERRGE